MELKNKMKPAKTPAVYPSAGSARSSRSQTNEGHDVLRLVSDMVNQTVEAVGDVVATTIEMMLQAGSPTTNGIIPPSTCGPAHPEGFAVENARNCIATMDRLIEMNALEKVQYTAWKQLYEDKLQLCLKLNKLSKIMDAPGPSVAKTDVSTTTPEVSATGTSSTVDRAKNSKNKEEKQMSTPEVKLPKTLKPVGLHSSEIGSTKTGSSEPASLKVKTNGMNSQKVEQTVEKIVMLPPRPPPLKRMSLTPKRKATSSPSSIKPKQEESAIRNMFEALTRPLQKKAVSKPKSKAKASSVKISNKNMPRPPTLRHFGVVTSSSTQSQPSASPKPASNKKGRAKTETARTPTRRSIRLFEIEIKNDQGEAQTPEPAKPAKMPRYEVSHPNAGFSSEALVVSTMSTSKVAIPDDTTPEPNSTRKVAVASPVQQDIYFCDNCNVGPGSFMCAGCSSRRYCSRECQEMNWESHSEECQLN